MRARVWPAVAVLWIAANVYVWFAMSAIPQSIGLRVLERQHEILWHQLSRPYVWSSEGR